MKAADIEKIIARHLLQVGALDDFLSTDDRSEQTMSILDALVQHKNRRMMDDLTPLATVHPQEIFEAFQTFGLFETSTYLQSLGGQHRFYDIKTVYMAALKLGNPHASWEDIAVKTAQASPLEIKNPQMVIRRDFETRMKAAIDAIGNQTGSVDDLPFTDDRLYLNSILISNCKIHYLVEAVDISSRLMESVLNRYDMGVALTTEEECLYAGRMALACQALPDNGGWRSDFFDKTVIQHLEDAHAACGKRAKFFRDYDDLVATEQQRACKVDELIARVRQHAEAGESLFITPVETAIKIYNYNLARKIHSILGNEVLALPHNKRPPRLGFPSA